MTSAAHAPISLPSSSLLEIRRCGSFQVLLFLFLEARSHRSEGNEPSSFSFSHDRKEKIGDWGREVKRGREIPSLGSGPVSFLFSPPRCCQTQGFPYASRKRTMELGREGRKRRKKFPTPHLPELMPTREEEGEGINALIRKTPFG